MEEQQRQGHPEGESASACTLGSNQATPAPGEGEQQKQVMQGEPEIVRLIHAGETEAVLRHIRSSSDFDANYKAAGGWSLLHMAALGDMVEVVAALADAGADLESEDHGGLRPLHYAASWDAQAALAELVRRGARLDCTSKDQLFYLNKIIPVFVVGGRTPLHLAVDKVSCCCALPALCECVLVRVACACVCGDVRRCLIDCIVMVVRSGLL
jgi:hypothetical protein